jgi:pimeloyl-ACP methyl ester carboxylesterase
MWALLTAACLSSLTCERIAVAPRESLRVHLEGQGSPVVLIPGLLGSAFGYRRLVPLLAAAGRRVVVIEPLGVGGSSRPPRADYSLAAQAGRIAAVLDSLGVRAAVLVAHAVGGSIALRLAVRRPDLVAGILALEGGAAEAAATPGFRRAMELAPWIRMFGGMRLIRGRVRAQLTGASADPAWVDERIVEGYTRDYAADLGATLRAFQGMAAAREPERLAAHLAEIRCPVRLLVGAAPHAGGVPPREIALLAAHLADFAVDSLPGVGHFPHEERPEAVVRAVVGMRG